MASKQRVTHEKCHICGESWDVDFMLDDEPEGMVCIPCNELVEQQIDEEDEVLVH